MLLNLPRAQAIMEKHKLDGLIAAQKQNIYYLTDHFPYALRLDRHFTTFAVLPRRADMPAALVIGMTENGRLANSKTWIPNIIAATGRGSPTAANTSGPNKEEGLGPLSTYIRRPNPVLSPVEEKWADLARARIGRMVVRPIDGLKRALDDAGLTKGRVGSDDPRVIGWMNEMGCSLQGVDASNIFREIRMVKSPDEIELLRKSAQANEAAVDVTIKAMHEGATQAELEREFMLEMVRQGGTGVYILLGMVSGLRQGKMVKGEPVMVDALSTYAGYNGDLGRTVVIGEPDAETRLRDKAMQKGRQVACEMMKPGVQGSELVRKVMDVVHKEGFPAFNHSVAHTVGLEHTDHPFSIGADGLGGVADFTVEENMVLNFDMPYQEWGWGSMHIEDTLCITRDGFKPLTSLKTALRQI